MFDPIGFSFPNSWGGPGGQMAHCPPPCVRPWAAAAIRTRMPTLFGLNKRVLVASWVIGDTYCLFACLYPFFLYHVH